MGDDDVADLATLRHNELLSALAGINQMIGSLELKVDTLKQKLCVVDTKATKTKLQSDENKASIDTLLNRNTQTSQTLRRNQSHWKGSSE